MNKNIVFSLSAWILCLCVILCSLSSCFHGNSGDPIASQTAEDGTSAEPDALSLSSYQIILSGRASVEMMDMAKGLSELFRFYTGVSVPVSEDDAEVSENTQEILLGKTNRPESATALSGLDGAGYVIENCNGTIVINGSDNAATFDAAEYFLQTCIRKTGSRNGTVILPSDFRLVRNYTSVDLKQKTYTIVYSDRLDDDRDGTYAHEGLDYEVQLAKDLCEKLISRGVGATVTTDRSAPVANEILIGSTNRADSVAFLNDMDQTQYGVGYRDGNFIIAGHSVAATVLANTMFNELLDRGTSDSGVSVTLGEARLRSNKDWVLTVPVYDGGTLVGSSECGYDELLYYISNTTAGEFSAYCEKLTAYGFEKQFENEIEGTLFRLYQTKKIRCYTYYSPRENVTRIIVGKPDSCALPESSGVYAKVTDASITQLELDFSTNSGGMGYVITLEDGSFFLIDSGSGTNSTSATQNQDHVRLWNLLNRLNKRADGKIVIRGWLITHCHADHVVVFRNFCNTFGNRVTIERYMEYIVPASVAYNSKNPGYSYANDVKGKVTGGFETCAVHAGMKFELYGLTFEMLYTVEDLYPQRLDYFNNASTTFRITIPDGSEDGKYQTLITGDIYNEACDILLKRYTSATLKSDIVQVSHHGNQGATQAFYKAVGAKVALWPTSKTLLDRLLDPNAVLAQNVIDRYVYSSVTENYTNGEHSYMLALPYSSGSATALDIPTTNQFP